ncbi:stage II sporulation protein M [Massilia antarctica]|uniref:stage II sporulation protein M n=1 Tax=Massilia antarctica TaxID=2765360 RepID=UPI0006BB7AF3|nr:stage II sporulation protein M [Massilia sp. H27-R4]MCY0916079.1 stage II sporulation protein M [Massilia sp. H27-R4]CUI08398.1 Integral membrane protein [Janthinobacterium sp. CG23_2]CUU32184.1 Integral membrane protein [Janthinobacterium sp. CG23_2]
MKQVQFEADNTALWNQIGAILDGSEHDVRALPALYRRLCQCLALCSQRGYSPALTDHLQKMVGACHRRLYGIAVERPTTLLRWMLVDFPCRVRAEWRLLLLTCLAFFGVALAVGLLVWYKPQWAYSFASAQQLDQFREMYQPGRVHVGRGGSQGDLMMFGFYIWNNVSIGFRSFAGGIFGGIPALISLGLNGMHLGVIGAWLSRDPATVHQFWSFVITHSSLEITGLLLCSMAGIRLGLALIHPGRRTRAHALHTTSQAMFPVIVGGSLMTMFAAFFEAFWSGSGAIPIQVKYAVGATAWALVIGFFLFAGRGKQ